MAIGRFPHRTAGLVAVPFFLVAGAAGGFVASLVLTRAPGPVTNAAIWAIVAAASAYVSYAGQGATRPASVIQAAVADGGVAGLGAGVAAALIDLLAATDAGGSGTVLSLSTAVRTLFPAALGGALAGGALGVPVTLAGGKHLTRPVSSGGPGGRRRAKRRTRRTRR